MKNNIYAVFYFGEKKTQAALVEKVKNEFKVSRVKSFDYSPNQSLRGAKSFTMDSGFQGGIDPANLDSHKVVDPEMDKLIKGLNGFILGEELSKLTFLTVVGNDFASYQKIEMEEGIEGFEKEIELESKGFESQITLADNSTLRVRVDTIDHILTVFARLARLNEVKKITPRALKTSQISLAKFLASQEKFAPNEYNLITHVENENLSFIFLRGGEILSIINPLPDKLTKSDFSILISKLLFEIEYLNIDTLSNIYIVSDIYVNELRNLFEQNFANSNVKDIELKNIVFPGYSDDEVLKFIIPISAAYDYDSDVLAKKKTFSLLPSKIGEEKRAISFDIYTLTGIAILVLTLGFFGFKYISNQNTIRKQVYLIQEMKIRAENNKELLAKINELQNRINSFQEILNKLNLLFSNSDLLSKELKKVADFAETKKEIWFTEYTLESNGSLKLQGLSGNRFNPSELTSSYEGGTLRNALVENLSGSIYYKFQIDAVLNPIY